MRLRKIALALLGLFACPVAVTAGPIEFGFGTSNLTFTNPNPGADVALTPIRPPDQGYSFDPASGTPTAFAVLGFDPRVLPAVPSFATVLPDGSVHWDADGNFGLPITVTDVASGQSETFTFFGQAHMVADFSPTTGNWTGFASFSSQDVHQFWLGGNQYTVWGVTTPGASTATVDVWVGTNPPVSPTPEPGTFALVALGLVPFGLRGLRRMW